MELNLRSLRYLVTVVDEGHFGRAAARLFITPPALTQQIRKLEREVGFSLLDREHHPVLPTPEGAAFLLEARAVLDAAERAEAVARSQSRRTRSRFDLGFVVTPLGRSTRAVVDAFTERTGPDVLRLVELTLAEQTGAVLGGRVDAALAWAPVAEPRLRVEPAVTAPRVLAVPPAHPLGRRDTVRIGELSGQTCVRMAPEMLGERWSRWWAADPRPDGIPVRYGAEVHTIAEFLEEVASGRAVAITSELLMHAYLRHDVVFVPIVDVEPSEIVLCTRPEDRSPMVALLRQLVQELPDQPR